MTPDDTTTDGHDERRIGHDTTPRHGGGTTSSDGREATPRHGGEATARDGGDTRLGSRHTDDRTGQRAHDGRDEHDPGVAAGSDRAGSGSTSTDTARSGTRRTSTADDTRGVGTGDDVGDDGSLGPPGTSILLVEDNDGDARLIEELLQMKGGLLDRGADAGRDFRIDRVETRAAAVDRIDEGGVDIVLLDLMLPDSRGEETLDCVLGRADDLPIIVMTGLNDRDFGVEAVKRGAQDFLVKGEFDGEVLVRAINYAIERKKNERELAARTAELEILTRILHHDIRNDMNIVRGRLRMAADDSASEEIETALSNVEHAIEITETVEPLLESITGDGELAVEPIALGTVLDEERRKITSSYPAATVRSAEDAEGVVVSANHMLSSVFGNLLNNAVQHNDGAEPVVDLSVVVDEDAGLVRVTVADDGPGVDPERRETLFERTVSGTRSSDTGLGLHLVARLAEEYGGDVWVEDSDLGGAAFVVELPLADGVPETTLDL